MNDILGKISSYNLFNYLLPGFLFVYISKRVSENKKLINYSKKRGMSYANVLTI
jgi:hypothetical protein